MAEQDELLSPEENLNVLLVQKSFGAVAKQLHQYVDKELKELHQKICDSCSTFETCHQQCSKPGIGITSWCDTCKEWRKHLLENLRRGEGTVHWDKMRSWEWPDNYLEIGRVYSPCKMCQNWETKDLNDLPMYLGIIQRCKIFPTSVSFKEMINKIRRERNYVVHKQSQRLYNTERDKMFKMLEEFISANEISKEVNSQSLLKELKNINNNREFETTTNILPVIQNIEQKTEFRLRNIELRVENIEKQGESRKQNLENQEESLNQDAENVTEEPVNYLQNPETAAELKNSKSSVSSNRQCHWSSIHVLHFIVLTLLFTKTGIESPIGCLSEDFSHPLEPELYLSHYITEYQRLAGRQWLLQNISETIFKEDFYHTGVLLVADMGFGKSALVSNIVCADFDQPAAELRAKLLAYHICKFDASNTKRTDLFIRRLAGMIANSIPEFSSILQTKKGLLSYLNSAECNYDPVGCMRQSIVFPLSEIERSIDKKQRMIIMIDGLDECEDTDNARNEILSVLERTADRFPAWIKFICTTRNIPSIVNKMGDFHVIQISANDTRNGKDIYDFIDRYLEEDETALKKLLKAWIFDEKMDVINKLVDMSAGNFLYVHLALRYLKIKDILSIQNIPNSLDKIYQHNFERVYGKREGRFQWAKKILEILGASKSPMKRENIFKIINFEYNNFSRDMYDEEMSFLMHFVTTTAEEYVFFAHISIYHWLTDIKRKGTPFFIDKEKGHYFIARYLFNIIKEGNIISNKHIIDLAVHVSESKTEDLVIYFKSLPSVLFNSTSTSTSLLHELAGQVNSYIATKLCLHFVKEVDSRNENNVTPAFIASGKGNVDTLQALLDARGDISFRRQLPEFFGYLEDPVLITKTRTFWGYGLLDIAAQHGHVDTTLHLLTRNRSLADVMNDMNVRPHHLACEFGHIQVLDAFLRFGPQFADQRCMYNAASNKHTNIVQKLLNLDVNDSCVPCNGSFYWVNENENRMQAKSSIPVYILNNMRSTLKPFDDWWTISCETALHAASRLGFTDIVQLLTSQRQNAMSCRDRAGRTPFLTAIIYNRTETISMLYPLANLSDKCLESILTDDEITRLSKLEIQKLSEGKCLNGLSVVHLISRYGLDNLAHSSIFHALNWEETDNQGNRPIHHAACHSGMAMIITLSQLNVDLFSRTPNGSTAFHLAALCRPVNLIWLKYINGGRLPQLYDFMNRSILQYMYISPLPKASIDGIQRDEDRTYLMKLLFSTEDITHIDLNRANILHSIIGNGYFLSMIDVYLKYQDEFLRLIRRRNSFNRTSLNEAFYNLPNDNFVVIKKRYSSVDQELLETFSNISEGYYLPYLSPIEQSILYFVRIVSQHTEHHKFFGKYVHDAIKKSNVYVTRMFLLYMKSHNVLDDRGYSPLHTFMSIGNNPFMGEIFLSNSSELIKCGFPLEKSPLHQISLNLNNLFWFVDSVKMQALLKGLTPAYLDQCFDAEGYNIFHRAVEGGNYELAKYFIDRGLLFIENEKLISTYIMLGVIAKFSFYQPNCQTYELHEFDESQHYKSKMPIIHTRTNYDLTLLLLLRKLNEGGYLTYNHICNTSTATLSLVHLAAANGLKQSLEYINNNWGKQALLCRNVDLMSPLYLSHVFEQHETIQYFKTLNVSLHFPKLQTAMFLAVILVYDIRNIKHETLNCLKEILRYYRLINHFPHNVIAYLRAFRYLKGLHCSKLLPLSNSQLTSLQNSSSLLFELLFIKFSNVQKQIRYVYDFAYARKLQDALKEVFGFIKNYFVPSIKAAFSAIYWNEIHDLKLNFTSRWLLEHFLHIHTRINVLYVSSLYFDTFSSIIDPKSKDNFTYLTLLTRIGRYRAMKTNDVLSTLNTFLKLEKKIQDIYEAEKVAPEMFPPIKAFSNSSDAQ